MKVGEQSVVELGPQIERAHDAGDAQRVDAHRYAGHDGGEPHFAVVLLTLLGAAGEALGYDRHLKSNTSKQRTHSLFRQGAMLYELIPTMPEPRLRPLIERFGAMMLEIPVFAGVYGTI